MSETPVDPAYIKSSYNLVRCGICGVPWTDHPRIIYCDRYRPSVDLVKSAHPDTIKIVTRNLEPETGSYINGKTNHEMRKLRCRSVLGQFINFVRVFRPK